MRLAKLSYPAVIEMKNAQPVIGGSAAEDDAMGSDAGRAILRHGPSILEEGVELLSGNFLRKSLEERLRC